MSKSSNRPIRVGLVSLGCAKNLVDAEIMLGSLLKSGLEITNQADQADVVIVNTCSFIEAAQKESVEAILEAAQARDQAHPAQGLIVSGCLPQRFREDLPKLLPEVDAFMGIDQVAQVSEIVQQALAGRREKVLRAGSKPANGASVKTISRHLNAPSLSPRGAGREPEREFPEKDRALHAGTLEHSSTAGSFSPLAGRRLGRGAPSLTGSRGEEPPSHTGESLSHPQEPLVRVHQRPAYIPDYATPRFRLTPQHFAYVKIAEGCNHPCSFCIIPQMRGAHRSRPQSDVVQEARQLLGSGVKELNLISQDSTYYGLDLRPNHSRAISSPEKFTAAARALPAGGTTLSTLLRELNDLPGDFWIRLLYTHPAHWTDELIETIARCPKVARYVDMPLQHIHDNMLERMRRETSRQHIVDLIARIRAGIPGIAIRTTFIVGFPGETDACFASLLNFIRETKFERLGVFTYSPQDGTRAGKMEGQIPDRVKKRRQQLAMSAQREVAREISASFLGREMTVLIEGEAKPDALSTVNTSSWEHGLIRSSGPDEGFGAGRFMVARGQADAPDIDGRIYVRGKLPPGTFARVKIIAHTDYDLLAQPLGMAR